MKTIVYIDGFNLYFGALKNTPYKWLDIVQLFSRICNDQEPQSNIVAVKFFTAPVKAKIASSGLIAVKSQESYHKALRTLYPETFEVIQGYFQVEKREFPRFLKPIEKGNRVAVWKMEEKKTDVNIAIEMLTDSMEGIEQVVLVSNDTDLVPALERIKKLFPEVKKAVVIPRKEVKEQKTRPANNELLSASDWTRNHITEKELQEAQLPEYIPTKKKTVFKPKYW